MRVSMPPVYPRSSVEEKEQAAGNVSVALPASTVLGTNVGNEYHISEEAKLVNPRESFRWVTRSVLRSL